MLRSLRKLSIKTKLTWIVLTLLIIPWMGYYYVIEMRQFLVQGQMNALLLTANGISTVLHDRPELFSPETGVPEVLGKEGDLYAHQLDNLVQIDGNANDWESVEKYASYYTGTEPFICTADYDPDFFWFKSIMGYYEQYLYALVDVADTNLVLRDLQRRSLDTSDQIRMIIQKPNGELSRYVLVAAEPGRMSIFLVDKNWQYPLEGSDITDFTAALKTTSQGYTVELRIPRQVIGTYSKVGFFTVNVNNEEPQELKAVSISPNVAGEEPSQILLISPELTTILKGLDQPESRIWILDTAQRVRAVVGGLYQTIEKKPNYNHENSNWLTRQLQSMEEFISRLVNSAPGQVTDFTEEVLYRPDKIFTSILRGTPEVAVRPSLDERDEIIVAGYPIRAGQNILGAVIIEQSSHAILTLQYQLLKSLTVATVLVFLFIFVALFAFAWRLSFRVRRLHNTTEQAITAEGRVLEDKIPKQAYPDDELGDLGRSITGMLKKLSGYTRYLEGMPDTLAHELNNPLNVVSSSLEILRSEQPQTVNNKHMQRAQNGVRRLRTILTNLTEAANLEEAMKYEVKTRVNLSSFVNECVGGYMSSHPQQSFHLDMVDENLYILGSEEHLAQMLDKLVDNALQFTDKNKPIVVRVSKNGDHAQISVLNEGPRLPEKIVDRLFDPMVSYGKTNAQFSHLGLGLFVVRLIAEYHQGNAWAKDQKYMKGVEVTVSIPLHQFFTSSIRS